MASAAREYDPTMVGLLLVESYVKSGEMNKGISVAKKLAEDMPSNANIQHHLGYIYQISGQIEKAIKQFEQALVIEHNHVKSVVSLANLDYKNGNVDSAINRLKIALTISANDTYLITALAKLYNRSNKSSVSVTLLEEKFKLDNKNEELLKSLIASYVGNKQLILAIETLDTYLLNQRKTVELYFIKARLHTIHSDLTSAVNAYKSAIKQGGEKGEIYLLIANVYQRFSKVSEAITAYKKAMAWDENNDQVIIGLAKLYNAENNTDSAIALIIAYQTSHDLSAPLVEALASSYLRTKQYDLAEKYYKKHIEIASNDSSVVGLNLVYRATQRANEAIAVLTKSLNQSPNSLLLNTALAELYIEQSQWHKADEIYQTLVNLYPKHPAILNNASYVALSLSDYQRAEALVKKSLAIVDNQQDSLDTLGWIYYHMKKFNEALPLFRKALAINNSNPVVKYHLALTLKALNRDKEAIKVITEVVNADSYKKAEAEGLLKQWLK